MDKKGKIAFLILLVLALLATFPGSSSAAKQPLNRMKKMLSGAAASEANWIGSSVIFPIRGNVYPDGYYYATLSIGIPAKPYYLDIDTGSDLTWVQCDAPCVNCFKGPHPLYKPNKNLLVGCQDPLCASLNEKHHCDDEDQCDYEVQYADHGSSLGVLVKDAFPLRFTNGSILAPRQAFGCGYDQELPTKASLLPTDGVLGLGGGKSSIVSQLHDQGLIRNVMGHCISIRGSGFLFLGNDLVPSSGIVWMPMLPNYLPRYSPGPAELIYGGKSTGLRRLPVIFDSGSSYTYFNSQAYETFVSLVKKDLPKKQLQEAPEEKALPICWKGSKPFKSVRDVQKFFKPIALSFEKRAQLGIPPEGYLIITSHGNVCLGILNGTQMGLRDQNVVGDISLQDKMVIFDNEKRQIGWTPADCDRLPKSRPVLF